MGFVADFKAFALKGNVIDMAVGVVIGGAFGKIVTAVVDDIIMPLVGMVSGNTKFTDKFAVLGAGKDGATSFKTLEEAKAAGANVLAYGHLIQSIVDFFIIALCIFVAIKQIAKLNKKEEPAPAVPEVSSTDKLLMEIRDALKK
ncbi:MAG: large conductance mechanosensitive channel protein MscL [Bacteroidetes bacterium]|nr:large conductance mechanosensitive channel protein MscL [Bacteroidota bacterium]